MGSCLSCYRDGARYVHIAQEPFPSHADPNDVYEIMVKSDDTVIIWDDDNSIVP